MLRNLGIRSKLLAVLCVPMAFLVAVSGVLVAQAAGDARRADRVQQLTTASTSLVGFVHQLQLERGDTLTYLATIDTANRQRLVAQRQLVDVQLAQLRKTIAASPIAQVSPDMARAVTQLSAQDGKINAERRAVDSGFIRFAGVQQYFDHSISAHLNLLDLLAEQVSDPTLTRALRNYVNLSAILEYAAQERDLLKLGAIAHTFTVPQHVAFIGVAAEQDQLLSQLTTQLVGTEKKQFQKAIADGQTSGYTDDRTSGLTTPAGKKLGIDADLWDATSNDRTNELTAVEQSYGQQVGAVAGQIGSAAAHKALLVGLVALAGLLIAVALVLFLARRITAPLRRLTTAAENIRVELPKMVEQMQTPGDTAEVAVEPIAVGGSDEIGRLAEAFNAVNDVTVRVALEQAALRGSIAEMFVNVARRNQTLLGRQLSFLDQLESREEDPDTLDDLFKLDHLAARMRRNAESLLVLAGIDATRRLRAPMAVSDVVRTAIGEIEDYHRIDLAVDVDPSVSGRVALSVAHLIAELIDNAAHFSNPDTRVEIAVRNRDEGAIEVYVADSGLGMSHQELVAANARLASPPATEIAVAQRLGLYVVGRIAKRLGATVTLHQRRSGGTAAIVGLPASVLAGLPAPAAVSPQSVPPANPQQSGTPLDAEPVTEQLGDAPAAAPATTAGAPFLPAALAADTGTSGEDGGWQPAFAPDTTALTARAAAPLTSRRRGAEAAPIETDQHVAAELPGAAEADQVQPVAEQQVAEKPVAEQPAAPDTAVAAEPVPAAERPRGRRENFFRRRTVERPAAVEHDDSAFALPEADSSIGLPDQATVLSALADLAAPMESSTESPEVEPVALDCAPEPVTLVPELEPEPIALVPELEPEPIALVPELEPEPEPVALVPEPEPEGNPGAQPAAVARTEAPAAELSAPAGTDELPDADTLSQLVEALNGPGGAVPVYEPVQEITSLPVAHDILPQRGRAARSGRSFAMPRRRGRGGDEQVVATGEAVASVPQHAPQPAAEPPATRTPEPVALAGAVPRTDPTDAVTPRTSTPEVAITEVTPTTEPAGPGDDTGPDGQGYGDDLAFRALAELSQLSAANYKPAYAPAGGLAKRQPRKAETAPAVAAERPSAARDAEQVRGVLSGFRAGVQRGRTNDPVSTGGAPVETTSGKEGQQ